MDFDILPVHATERGTVHGDIARLCDALDAARAQVATLTKERNRARILWDKYAVQAMDHLQLAEKAEAERDALRAKAAVVRALCEPYGDPPIDATPTVVAILAALDGPGE
jgi:hypothetical protein